MHYNSSTDDFNNFSTGKHSAVRKQALVSFNEALGFFQTCNMEKYMVWILTYCTSLLIIISIDKSHNFL